MTCHADSLSVPVPVPVPVPDPDPVPLPLPDEIGNGIGIGNGNGNGRGTGGMKTSRRLAAASTAGILGRGIFKETPVSGGSFRISCALVMFDQRRTGGLVGGVLFQCGSQPAHGVVGAAITHDN